MGRSIAFIQMRSGAGKSTCCAQLAATLAAARPELTVTVVDASLHADATHALVGGMQEPLSDENEHTSRGEEIVAAYPGRTTFALINALANLAAAEDERAAAAAARPSWGRYLGYGRRADVIDERTPPPLNETNFSFGEFCIAPAEAHAVGRAPRNLRVVAGGPELASVAGGVERAERAGKFLSRVISSTGEEHILFFDTDAELGERAASAFALAAAGEAALVFTSNWADALRFVRDPINGIEIALAHYAARAGSSTCESGLVSKIVFTQIAKHRNEPSGFPSGGPECFGFKPVAAAARNAENIARYVHERASGDGPLRPHVRGADGVDFDTFVEQRVLGLPAFPETVLAHSVLYGIPIACMAPADGVSAEALDAAKEALDHAARRIV